ncbi:hypothetical protein ACLOJK_029395 [Asimina triloba]
MSVHQIAIPCRSTIQWYSIFFTRLPADPTQATNRSADRFRSSRRRRNDHRRSTHEQQNAGSKSSRRLPFRPPPLASSSEQTHLQQASINMVQSRSALQHGRSSYGRQQQRLSSTIFTGDGSKHADPASDHPNPSYPSNDRRCRQHLLQAVGFGTQQQALICPDPVFDFDDPPSASTSDPSPIGHGRNPLVENPFHGQADARLAPSTPSTSIWKLAHANPSADGH